MMGIAFGVMLANQREVVVLQALLKDRRMGAIIVFHRRPKFLGVELAEVVEKAMKPDPTSTSIDENMVPMAVYQTPVAKEFLHWRILSKVVPMSSRITMSNNESIGVGWALIKTLNAPRKYCGKEAKG